MKLFIFEVGTIWFAFELIACAVLLFFIIKLGFKTIKIKLAQRKAGKQSDFEDDDYEDDDYEDDDYEDDEDYDCQCDEDLDCGCEDYIAVDCYDARGCDYDEYTVLSYEPKEKSSRWLLKASAAQIIRYAESRNKKKDYDKVKLNMSNEDLVRLDKRVAAIIETAQPKDKAFLQLLQVHIKLFLIENR